MEANYSPISGFKTSFGAWLSLFTPPVSVWTWNTGGLASSKALDGLTDDHQSLAVIALVKQSWN
jgi:hypothetical protein